MNETKLGGDSPCFDCWAEENPVWFTDNVFWNEVMGKDKLKILCTDCFIVKAEKKYKVTGWRLIPEFKWQRKKRTPLKNN